MGFLGKDPILRFDATSTSILTPEFAKRRTEYVEGERFSFDVVANRWIPPLELDSIIVTVTGYKSVADHQKEMAKKGYECYSKRGLHMNTPMVFIEVDSVKVGETHEPKLVSTLGEKQIKVASWELAKIKLDREFVESFVVHVGFKEPGIYKYKAEAVFQSRIGRYQPEILFDEREIFVEGPLSAVPAADEPAPEPAASEDSPAAKP